MNVGAEHFRRTRRRLARAVSRWLERGREVRCVLSNGRSVAPQRLEKTGECRIRECLRWSASEES